VPWNLKSRPHNEPEFEPNSQLLELTKNDWHQMEQPLFNTLFKNSAVKRTGFSGLKRNLQFIQPE
jgi:epoxyqueuosine reductase